MAFRLWRSSPMRTRFLLASLLAFALLPACVAPGGGQGDDDPGEDPPPPACGNLSGTWQISGDCGGDLCTITQADCAITAVTCTSGARSTSGSLAGNQFMYTGVSGGGIASTCTGTLAAGAISGSCNLAGVSSCTFSGGRR
jgi:hypothetical protein